MNTCILCLSSATPGAIQCPFCSEAGRCFTQVPGTEFQQCGLSPPGFYGPPGADNCQPCPSSVTFGDHGKCNADCNEPTTCLNNAECITTPSGFYSYSGTSQCIPCSSATVPGMTSCPLEKNGIRDCSAAGMCVAGGVCAPVPSGFYSPAGVDACVVCFGTIKGATTCDSCKDAGFCFSPIPGTNLKSCGPSPPGYYGPNDEDNCQKCPGKTVYGDDGFCEPTCTSATTCLYDGICQVTPPGYYSTNATSQCIPCASAAASASTSCPILFAGSDPLRPDLCAEAGKCLINGNCRTAPKGFYAPHGVSTCLMCLTSTTFGASKCPVCADAGLCFSMEERKRTGYTQCGLSPPGYYGPKDEEVCQPCAGKSTYGDNGVCEPDDCPADQCLYQGGCKKTPPGYYSYEGTNQCLPCRTSTAEGATVCKLESAGVRDCSAAGLCVAGGVCGPVPAGFYSPAGVDACILCAGSEPGASACPTCSAAGFCAVIIPGTTLKQCGLSIPGYYGPAGVDACQPCPSAVTFGDNGYCTPSCSAPTQCLWMGKCQTTPVGYYSYDGTSQCVPCASASSPGSTRCPLVLEQLPCAEAGKCLINAECKAVPAGFYSPSGVESCLLCMGSKEGAQECPRCNEAGRCFFPVPGTDLNQCGLSPPGYYGPPGTDYCHPCPSLTTFGDNGRCNPQCQDPTSCLYAGTCGVTPPGYYSYNGTSQCLPCATAINPGSTFCPTEKMAVVDCTAAGQCVAGGVCGPVPAGFYSPAGVDACIICVGSQHGATSCNSCDDTGVCFTDVPGKFNQKAIKSCGLSPPGFYGPEGTEMCVPCPSSLTFGDNGICQPRDCEMATQCLYEGQCKLTPPGFYSYSGTSQCIPCPSASSPGSTSCRVVLAGRGICSEPGKCLIGGSCLAPPSGLFAARGSETCLTCRGALAASDVDNVGIAGPMGRVGFPGKNGLPGEAAELIPGPPGAPGAPGKPGPAPKASSAHMPVAPYAVTAGLAIMAFSRFM